MKLKLIVLSIGVISLAACAGRKSTTVPSLTAVLGTWNAETTQGSTELAMTIKRDSVTVTKVCSDGPQPVTASVTSRAIVTETSIEILKSIVDVKPTGGVPCEARVDRGFMKYEVKDGKLILAPSGKSAFVFGSKLPARVVKPEAPVQESNWQKFNRLNSETQGG